MLVCKSRCVRLAENALIELETAFYSPVFCGGRWHASVLVRRKECVEGHVHVKLAVKNCQRAPANKTISALTLYVTMSLCYVLWLQYLAHRYRKIRLYSEKESKWFSVSLAFMIWPVRQLLLWISSPYSVVRACTWISDILHAGEASPLLRSSFLCQVIHKFEKKCLTSLLRVHRLVNRRLDVIKEMPKDNLTLCTSLLEQS